MDESLVFRVYQELAERGYEVRINRRRTHVQLKYCMCGNPNWNLDIELDELFCFSCWACGYSGRSSTILRKLGCRTRIPNPDGTSARPVTQQTYLYHAYPTLPQLIKREAESLETLPLPDLCETPSALPLSGSLKRVFASHPITVADLTSTDGYMLLGEYGFGTMLYDVKTHQNRKTAADIYLYKPVTTSATPIKTLVVVEGFADIFPFFMKSVVLVIGGSLIPVHLLEQFAQRYQFSQIILALDKKAEKPFLKRLRPFFPTSSILIMEPEKHSPAESQFLKLKALDYNLS